MAEPNYGTDLALAFGFEGHFPTASGRLNLLYAVFRRITTSSRTEAGQEIYEGRCMDVREQFLVRLDPTRLPGIERQVERVCTYDDRVESAVCKATFNFTKKKLVLATNITPADGSEPFPLILSVDNVNLELLQNG